MYHKIKSDYLDARKTHDNLLKRVLGPIVAEATPVGSASEHMVSDSEMIAILKRHRKNITISRDATLLPSVRSDLEEELDVVNEYLGPQLSETELRDVIDGLVSKGFNNMGGIMKALKAEHAGGYDAKLASTIAREYLS